jgi:hypothetical protein
MRKQQQDNMAMQQTRPKATGEQKLRIVATTGKRAMPGRQLLSTVGIFFELDPSLLRFVNKDNSSTMPTPWPDLLPRLLPISGGCEC